LGDASIKFFHAHATIKYRRNLITSLQDSVGLSVSTHEEKAQLFWDSFKERLGSSSFTGITFDLPALIQGIDDLSSLVSPFGKEEIDRVIRHLPSDKVPGPGGFNTDFFKKCWSVISNDFYTFCNAFYHADVCLRSINGSHIVCS
jgi:hypothetical protein